MKYVILLMIILLFSGVSCFAQGNLSSKINLTGASSVAEKANKDLYFDGCSSGIMQDPMMQGALNGYYNAMQGMAGGSFNAQEQQKQQMEYTRQQADQFR